MVLEQYFGFIGGIHGQWIANLAPTSGQWIANLASNKRTAFLYPHSSCLGLRHPRYFDCRCRCYISLNTLLSETLFQRTSCVITEYLATLLFQTLFQKWSCNSKYQTPIFG